MSDFCRILIGKLNELRLSVGMESHRNGIPRVRTNIEEVMFAESREHCCGMLSDLQSTHARAVKHLRIRMHV
jgi:hypothetical protein